jgi:hypothetical protein
MDVYFAVIIVLADVVLIYCVGLLLIESVLAGYDAETIKMDDCKSNVMSIILLHYITKIHIIFDRVMCSRLFDSTDRAAGTWCSKFLLNNLHLLVYYQNNAPLKTLYAWFQQHVHKRFICSSITCI